MITYEPPPVRRPRRPGCPKPRYRCTRCGTLFEAEPGPIACPCGCHLVTWVNHAAVDWLGDNFGEAHNHP